MNLMPELSSVIFGLASAITWGAGDFTGGLITKRVNVYTVVIISQVVGASLLLGLALLSNEPFPQGIDLFFGGAAGISGAFGLVNFYRSLAFGRMGVVAPVAAVVTAGLPVVFGILSEGLPGGIQIAGFILAFFALWLISTTGAGEHIQFADLGRPIIAGIGFAGFFILMDQVTTGAVFWPLVAARGASLSFLTLSALVLRQGERPGRGHLPAIALAGILDVGGNVFYILAAQAGRLDIAAVLASLYPAMTVLLARTILKEQLSHQQWIGLGLTLLAVILITM